MKYFRYIVNVYILSIETWFKQLNYIDTPFWPLFVYSLFSKWQTKKQLTQHQFTFGCIQHNEIYMWFVNSLELFRVYDFKQPIYIYDSKNNNSKELLFQYLFKKHENAH